MDQIRGICSEIQTASSGLLIKDTEEARASANATGLIGALGSAAVFVLLLLSTITIRRGTRRRHQLIQALQQAKEARDWLQTTLGSIGDGVIATDTEGRVTFLNGVAQSLTGWNQEQAVRKPLEDIFIITNEETGAVVENPVHKALREGRVVGLANHTRLTARDGRQLSIDDSAAPIRDGHGRVIGVVLVFRDVTERKEAERAMHRGVAELRRANEDLNHFAFAASPDLQEPLRMVTSYSQLLVKTCQGQLSSEASVCVENITDGTKRMRGLLADLLAYTQLSGEAEEPDERVSLNLVFQKAAENCKTAIDESEAIVTVEQLPTVTGSEPHFLQLFQNLLSNAIKYRAPDRRPKVHAGVQSLGAEYQFSIQDNGIGIDPQYHQKIFGVFKRLHGRNIPGTGIGLATCQRVVDRMGGRIWVESQLDRGSTFYFTIPKARGESK